MSVKTDYSLKSLHVLAWIIFIGVCIEAGGFLFNMIYTLQYNPEGARKFWTLVDLSAVYHHNQRDYITITALMVIVAVLKATFFYVIVQFFHNKTYSLEQPFKESVRRFILTLTYIAFGISFFSFWGSSHAQGLVKQGVPMPDMQHLRLAGAEVWLFLGIALTVIAQVFKKGIEIQAENDLTV